MTIRLMEYMPGQYKSSMCCPVCKHDTITFKQIVSYKQHIGPHILGSRIAIDYISSQYDSDFEFTCNSYGHDMGKWPARMIEFMRPESLKREDGNDILKEMID